MSKWWRKLSPGGNDMISIGPVWFMHDLENCIVSFGDDKMITLTDDEISDLTADLLALARDGELRGE